jgi:hypothetical protein
MENDMADKLNDGRTIVLKGVRLSFTDSLYLKKKTAKTDDAKEAHSCNVILEKGSEHFEANKALVVSALRAACEDKWAGKPDRYKEISADDRKRVCFRKGETFKNQTSGEVYEGYADNYVIAGKGPRGGQQRPKLLDRQKRPVTDSEILDVFYAGTYADVIVAFYGTEKGGNGVFCSIEAIRSHQTGERMAGGFDVDPDVFDDLGDDDGFAGVGGDDDDDLGI